MTKIQSSREKYLFFCFQITELLHEGGFWREATRFQEVEQAEELLHGVLQRGPGQQHFVFLQERKGSPVTDHNKNRFSKPEPL